MDCPVINFHKNRSKKWWLGYIGAWIVGIVSCTMINIPNAMWEEYNEQQNRKEDKQ